MIGDGYAYAADKVIEAVLKPFRNAAHFLKIYWALKRNADPEKVAEKLGRPEKLELSEDQAKEVQSLFCGIPLDETGRGRPAMEPMDIARSFFNKWPRTNFRYFMAVSPDNQSLEFTNADSALDGVELIQAAMVKLGAVVYHAEHPQGAGWYYQTAHPMVKRMAELGANQGDLTAITKKKSILA